MKRGTVLMMALLVVFAGCGTGSRNLTAAGSSRLSSEVAALRSAAEVGDRPGAEAALSTLRRSVAELQESKEIGGSEAADVLAAAAEVENNLGSIPTTTTTTTVVVAPPREPAVDEHFDGEGGDRGKGRGKDSGKGDD